MAFSGFAAVTMAEGFAISAAAVVIVGGVGAAVHSVIKASHQHANSLRDVKDLRDALDRLSRRSDESKEDRSEIRRRIYWLTRDADLSGERDNITDDDD